MTTKCKYPIGTQFNKLTVVGYDSEKKYYICQCACGNITTSRIHAMTTGKHRQCRACSSKEKSETTCLPNNLGLKSEIFRNYQRAAKKRNYSFELTQDEFIDLISEHCYYCGALPSMIWYGTPRKNVAAKEFRYNGVDRKDNSIGYTKSNCVSCCKICNNSKSTLTENEWFDWIKKIFKYQFERSTTIP